MFMIIMFQLLTLAYVVCAYLKKHPELQDNERKKERRVILGVKSIKTLVVVHFLVYLFEPSGIARKQLLSNNPDAAIPYLMINVVVLIFLYGAVKIGGLLHIDGEKIKNVFHLLEKTVKEEETRTPTGKELKKQWLLALVAVVVSCCYYPVFLFSVNASHGATPQDLMEVGTLFLSSALIFLVLLVKINHNPLFSGVYVCAFVLIVENFRLLGNIVSYFFPMLFYWHLLFLFFVSAKPCYDVLKKYTTGEISTTMLQVSTFVFSLLIVFNLFSGVPAWSTYQKKQFQLKNMNTEPQKVENQYDLPNVYYLLFDEYADPETLEKYSGYDNSDFYAQLEARGFAVSAQASNGVDSYSTASVLPEYFNFGEQGNLRADLEDRYGYLWFNMMEEQGYEIRGVGASHYIHIPSLTETESTSAKSIDGYGFFDIFMQRTLFFPLYEAKIDYFEQERENILKAFHYFETAACYDSDQPIFTALYLITPHAPFLFDKNGDNVSPRSYTSRITSQSAYLEQYQYVTGLILNQVDEILTYDPDSVIIFQSDHSYRDLIGVTEEEKKRVANAVYYRGESFPEVEDATAVNALILVVNRLFGLDLELKEELTPWT